MALLWLMDVPLYFDWALQYSEGILTTEITVDE